MSGRTASLLVLASWALLLVGTLYTHRQDSFASNYRRLWGVSVLGLGGALLADFAPQAVGPFFAAVLLVYLIRSGVVGRITGQAAVAASGQGRATPGAGAGLGGSYAPAGG